jgi:AhpD family alkylhydroperoxidase
MSGPRITPGSRREVGLATAAFARIAGLVMGSEPPAIFLVLGRQRRLFRGWLHFAGRLMPGGTLPRREAELVILRVAHLHGSAYEWAHHERLGRRAGVTRADLDRLRTGPAAPGWSARERALLTVADELHRDGDVSDAAWAAVREHLDEATTIELLLLCGHYAMLAQTLGALRLAPDAPGRRLSRRAAGTRSSR